MIITQELQYLLRFNCTCEITDKSAVIKYHQLLSKVTNINEKKMHFDQLASASSSTPPYTRLITPVPSHQLEDFANHCVISRILSTFPISMFLFCNLSQAINKKAMISIQVIISSIIDLPFIILLICLSRYLTYLRAHSHGRI